jgi:hypothetical protein
MPLQLERSMQSLNAECAWILQTLRHGEVIDKGGDAQEVLRVLQPVKDSLDVAIACADLLWTRQNLFKVWQSLSITTYNDFTIGNYYDCCHEICVYCRSCHERLSVRGLHA